MTQKNDKGLVAKKTTHESNPQCDMLYITSPGTSVENLKPQTIKLSPLTEM